MLKWLKAVGSRAWGVFAGAIAGLLQQAITPYIGFGALVAFAAVEGFLVHSMAHVWIVFAASAAALTVGVCLGRFGTNLPLIGQRDRLHELENRAQELEPYARYTIHIKDALDALRGMLDGRYTAPSLRDLIEVGIFEPARALLMEDGRRGDVRFSILETDGDDFVMCKRNKLAPALGHRLESRQAFRLPINESFSQFAYRRDQLFFSNELSEDPRFDRHGAAEDDRTYESIVSVPTHARDRVFGVLNVIATSKNAFMDVDRDYIDLLASVMDVAVVARMQQRRAQRPPQLPPGGVGTS